RDWSSDVCSSDLRPTASSASPATTVVAASLTTRARSVPRTRSRNVRTSPGTPPSQHTPVRDQVRRRMYTRRRRRRSVGGRRRRRAGGTVVGMPTATAATLAVLALVHSTSFGTLLIPVCCLLTPGRVRVARILVFLGTVAGFYLLLGVALVAGLDAVLGDLDAVL